MADYLDNVGTQLAQLTARGVDRSSGPTLVREPQRHGGRHDGGGGQGGGNRRSRREALVVVAALVVAIVVVVGLLVLGLGANHNTPTHQAAITHHEPPPARHRHRHRGAPRTSTARHLSSKAPASATAPRHVQVPAGPVPPGFGPDSFTALGTDTWWLLGTAPCSDPPCTSILRTDDGGHSFVGIPAPRTTQVSQMRFANAADGFAYDSQLWVTHDAGAGWHQVRLGGAVTQLATANGFAYALVRFGHKGAGRLERAPLGSDAWTTLTAAGSAYAGLWAHGSDVLVGADSGAALHVSHNAGVSFTSTPSPSKGLPCDFEEPARNVVWAHCATGTESATWRSTDSGAHFRLVPGPSQPNTGLFAAASADTAALGADKVFRITGGGTHHALVPTVATTHLQYLGFTDAAHGVALGYDGSLAPANERLYYTSDGGLSYRLVSTG
ncbi:MAG TPA: hypothetical protein VIY10_18345 [Solirubrobacteraceae bacterium]